MCSTIKEYMARKLKMTKSAIASRRYRRKKKRRGGGIKMGAGVSMGAGARKRRKGKKGKKKGGFFHMLLPLIMGGVAAGTAGR